MSDCGGPRRPRSILILNPVAALLEHFGLATRGELARHLGLYDGTYLRDVQRGYTRPVKLAAVVRDRFGLDLAELCQRFEETRGDV